MPAGVDASALTSLSSLADLPLSRDQLLRLGKGERRPYQLLEIDGSGGMRRRGRVYALLLVRKPLPTDRKVRREDRWLYKSGDEEWLPLIVDGRLVGTLVTRPAVAVNYDPDGDGVVEARVIEKGNSITWWIEDTPSAWRFLEDLWEGRSACGALRGAFGRNEGAKAESGVGGFFMKVEGFDPCSGKSGGGRENGGIGSGRRHPLQVSPRCRRVLEEKACRSRSIPGGWAEDGMSDLLAWLVGEGAARLLGAAKTAKDIGDFLVGEAMNYYRDHYVNEADQALHDFEKYLRSQGHRTVESARRSGLRPSESLVRAACAAGSQSAFCNGPDPLGERSKLPDSKKRSPEYWKRVKGDLVIDGSRKGQGPGENPLRGPDVLGGGRSVAQLQCDACLAQALYAGQADRLLEEARSRCENPASQPSPAAEAGGMTEETPGGENAPSNPATSWFGGAGKAGKEVECAAHGAHERTEPPTIEELTAMASGCGSPTARPMPGTDGAGNGGAGCKFRQGVNANEPTIGIAFGTVFGLGPCAEEVCQPDPSR